MTKKELLALLAQKDQQIQSLIKAISDLAQRTPVQPMTLTQPSISPYQQPGINPFLPPYYPCYGTCTASEMQQGANQANAALQATVQQYARNGAQ